MMITSGVSHKYGVPMELQSYDPLSVWLLLFHMHTHDTKSWYYLLLVILLTLASELPNYTKRFLLGQ